MVSRSERALQIAADGRLSCTYADEAQSRALGLPPQRGGWGLLRFDNWEQAVVAACDPALVAALEERHGNIPGWDQHVKLWADWDDVSIAMGSPLTWETEDPGPPGGT